MVSEMNLFACCFIQHYAGRLPLLGIGDQKKRHPKEEIRGVRLNQLTQGWTRHRRKPSVMWLLHIMHLRKEWKSRYVRIEIWWKGYGKGDSCLKNVWISMYKKLYLKKWMSLILPNLLPKPIPQLFSTLYGSFLFVKTQVRACNWNKKSL